MTNFSFPARIRWLVKIPANARPPGSRSFNCLTLFLSCLIGGLLVGKMFKISFSLSPPASLPPAMEGDGEVIIGPVQNCSHCESAECYDVKHSICYCEEDLILAPDSVSRVSCINVTGLYSIILTPTYFPPVVVEVV